MKVEIDTLHLGDLPLLITSPTGEIRTGVIVLHEAAAHSQRIERRPVRLYRPPRSSLRHQST